MESGQKKKEKKKAKDTKMSKDKLVGKKKRKEETFLSIGKWKKKRSVEERMWKEKSGGNEDFEDPPAEPTAAAVVVYAV